MFLKIIIMNKMCMNQIFTGHRAYFLHNPNAKGKILLGFCQGTSRLIYKKQPLQLYSDQYNNFTVVINSVKIATQQYKLMYDANGHNSHK